MVYRNQTQFQLIADEELCFKNINLQLAFMLQVIWLYLSKLYLRLVLDNGRKSNIFP